MKAFLVASLFALLASPSFGVKIMELSSGWNVWCRDFAVANVRVPSGVHQIFEKAGHIENVLEGYNDLNLSWIGRTNWTYSVEFDVPESFRWHKFHFLTFHGVDTVAFIRLNDYVLGFTDNMFQRYSFNARGLLKFDKPNKLEVNIRAPVEAALDRARRFGEVPPACPFTECHVNQIRKVQSSFGAASLPSIPTVGIWKPVALEFYNTPFIRDVTYKLVLDSQRGVWDVSIRVFLEMGKTRGLKAQGDLSAEFVTLINVPEAKTSECVALETDEGGEITAELSLSLPTSSVKTWWPNVVGSSQQLYILLVKFEDQSSEVLAPKEQTSEKQIKVGFRTVELVQEPVEDQEGLSFRIKVNGVEFFMKGANLLPTSVFPEDSYNSWYLRRLFRSLKAANMNMLRVWGGGYYESDEFYALADEYGILVWQDAAFASSFYPTNRAFIETVEMELKQNARRIQSHPSLVVWALNYEIELILTENRFTNESEYEKLEENYVSFFNNTVRRTLEENDGSRPVLLTSPGYGPGIPEDPLGFIGGEPNSPWFGDIHQFNFTFNLWDSRNYPRPRFVSSYGHQSVPSRQQWVKSLGRSSELKELIEHRQHFENGTRIIDDQIYRNLPDVLDEEDENYWEYYIYFTQISQAIALEEQTSVYRVENGNPGSRNTMGALVWHYNDAWTAPTSSVLEINGRKKIAWFSLQNVFQPEAVISLFNAQDLVDIFIVNETDMSRNFDIIIRIYKTSSLAYVDEINEVHEGKRGSVTLAMTFDLTQWIAARNGDPREYFMKIMLRHTNDYSTISRDFIAPAMPKNLLNVQDAGVKVKIGEHDCFRDVNQALVSIEISISAPAFFVFLELNVGDIDVYEFSANGFIQTEPVKVVHLRFDDPHEDCDTKITADDLDVLVLNQFLRQSGRRKSD